MRRAVLPLLFAAATTAALLAAAPAQRFKLNLADPMRAGNVRLEPGEYDVTFEPSPAGAPHFVAVFSRGGVRVATAPAELKGAPAGFKVSEISMNEWMKASFDHKHARRDGSIHPAKFEFQARTERAFFEALLTEVGMPEADASSKAPAVVTVKTPRGIPQVAPPTPTPTPSKK